MAKKDSLGTQFKSALALPGAALKAWNAATTAGAVAYNTKKAGGVLVNKKMGKAYRGLKNRFGKSL